MVTSSRAWDRGPDGRSGAASEEGAHWLPRAAAVSYTHLSVIVVLAIAMGIQNAGARKLAVPDLTTTVLTMTITGVAADSHVAGGQGSKAARRLIAIAAMLLGAVIGATLVLHALIAYPLAIALVVTVFAAAASWMLARSSADWVREQ